MKTHGDKLQINKYRDKETNTQIKRNRDKENNRDNKKYICLKTAMYQHERIIIIIV